MCLSFTRQLEVCLLEGLLSFLRRKVCSWTLLLAGSDQPQTNQPNIVVLANLKHLMLAPFSRHELLHSMSRLRVAIVD